MSIVEFDGLPSWFLDPSETEDSTKCPWVGVVGLIVWGWRGAHRALHYPYPRAFCTLLIKRPRWRPVELNDWHLRSHGKIGDCEQSSRSIEQETCIYWYLLYIHWSLLFSDIKMSTCAWKMIIGYISSEGKRRNFREWTACLSSRQFYNNHFSQYLSLAIVKLILDRNSEQSFEMTA